MFFLVKSDLAENRTWALAAPDGRPAIPGAPGPELLGGAAREARMPLAPRCWEIPTREPTYSISFQNVTLRGYTVRPRQRAAEA